MWILTILANNLAVVFVTELLLGFILGARSIKKVVTMALINIITNPIVVMCALCLTLFYEEWRYVGIFILELAVLFTEGYMFSKFKVFDKGGPYIISFVLNFTSFVVGKLINIFL